MSDENGNDEQAPAALPSIESLLELRESLQLALKDAQESKGELLKLIASVVAIVDEVSEDATAAKKRIAETVVAVQVVQAELVDIATVAKTASSDAVKARDAVAMSTQTLEATRAQDASIRETILGTKNDAAAILAEVKAVQVSVVDAQKTVLAHVEPTVSAATRASEQADSAKDARSKIDGEIGNLLALCGKATSYNAETAAHSAKLEKIVRDSEAHLKEINELLRMATSTALATSFDSQQRLYRGAVWGWGVTTVSSLLLLVYLAISFEGDAVTSVPLPGGAFAKHVDWDLFLAHIPVRITVIGALVWLAWFAGRRHGEAQRLREDYTFKARLSTAFEGYRKKAEQMGSAADEFTRKLFDNTLHELALRPGRLYDSPKETMPMVELVSRLSEAATGLVRELGVKEVADKLPNAAEILKKANETLDGLADFAKRLNR